MKKFEFKTYTPRENGNRCLEEAVDEVLREIDVRQRIYDNWVKDCKISRTDAHDRLERMMSALKWLHGIPSMPNSNAELATVPGSPDEAEMF